MSLLARAIASEAAADFLRWPADFDPTATDHVEAIRLASGTPMTPIGGDGSGGTYFLIGETGGEDRPILYADSEGGAAYIASSLADFLQLQIGLPYWHDCLYDEPADLTEAETEFIEALYEPHEIPDFHTGRTAALAALGLPEVPARELLARLRTVALTGGELPRGPEGNAYDSLVH